MSAIQHKHSLSHPFRCSNIYFTASMNNFAFCIILNFITLQDSLNELMGLGKSCWTECRDTLQRILSSSESVLRDSPLRKTYVQAILHFHCTNLPTCLQIYIAAYTLLICMFQSNYFSIWCHDASSCQDWRLYGFLFVTRSCYKCWCNVQRQGKCFDAKLVSKSSL